MLTSPNLTAKIKAKRCNYYIINNFTKEKKICISLEYLSHYSATSTDTLVFNFIEAKHADTVKLLAQQQDKVQTNNVKGH